MGIIRFILAVSVVTGHSSGILGLELIPSSTAVQAFYIISGFYMSLILNEKYVLQPNAFRLFITNRFLRLFPTYWIVLVLTLLFSALALHYPGAGAPEKSALQMYAEYIHDLRLWSLMFLVFTNLFLFLQDAVIFLGLNTTSGNLFFATDYRITNPQLNSFLLVPQAWTIGVELLFYLIAPLLVRRNVKVVAALIFASLLLRAGLYRMGLHHDPWTYRFFPTELAYFLSGTLAYAIFRKIRARHLGSRFLNAVWIGLVLASVLYSLVEFPGQRQLYLAAVCLGLPFIFHQTHGFKADAYIGELSYPIYISHILVRSVIQWLGLPLVGGLGLSLTIATVLFSVVLHESVVKRIEKFRQHRVARSTPPAAAPAASNSN